MSDSNLTSQQIYIVMHWSCYRQPFYTNAFFTLSVFVLGSVTAMITLYPGSKLAGFLQLMFDPKDPTKHLIYRLQLMGWVALNTTLCVFIEKAIVERRWLKKVVHFLIRKKQPRNKFRRIEKEMELEGWPYVLPLNQ